MQVAEKQFYSFADAENATTVSHWTWRYWAKCGKVGTIKLGRRRLIPASEMKRVLTEAEITYRD